MQGNEIVRRLQTEHQWSSLQRHVPSIRAHIGMRANALDRHLQLQSDAIARLPAPLNAHISVVESRLDRQFLAIHALFPLRAGSKLRLPIDLKGSQIIALGDSGLPLAVLADGTNEFNLIVLLTQQDQSGIHIASIHQMSSGKQRAGGQGLMDRFGVFDICFSRISRLDVGDQVGKVFIAGFLKWTLYPNQERSRLWP